MNVLVGENGVGKTHIMKLAYAACKSSKHDVSFSQKTTMLFRPDQSSIGRLVNRNKNGNNAAKVSVESDAAKIGMTFSTKTRKWDAEIQAEENWEKQMSDLTSVFIPAKEILSNAWNLDAAVKMGNVTIVILISLPQQRLIFPEALIQLPERNIWIFCKRSVMEK